MVYHDIYIEQPICQKEKKSQKLFMIFCVIMILWALFLEIITFNLAYSVLVIIFILLMVWLNRNRRTDFDYIYTNGVFEIDRIRGQSKRKNLFSIDIENLVVMAPSRTEPVQPYIGKRMTTYDCTSHEEGVPYYTMIIKHPALDREIKVLFEPNEELLRELKRKGGTKVTV